MKTRTEVTIVLVAVLSLLFVIGYATAHAATLPRCRAGHLAVTATREGAAGGSTYYRIRFTNTRPGACTLGGYPGASFVTRHGRQVGEAATRNPAHPARTLTVQPGGDVSAVLALADPGNYPPATCRPARVGWLRVYPPNAYQAHTVRLRAVACTARIPDLSVTPVESSHG